MGNVNDMLDEIMSDLGISDELARSIRQTEEHNKSDKPVGTKKKLNTDVSVKKNTEPLSRTTYSQKNTSTVTRRNVSTNSTTSISKKPSNTSMNSSRTKNRTNDNNIQNNRKRPNNKKNNKRVLSKKSVLKISVMSLHILVNVIIYTLAVIAIVKVSEAAYDFAYQIYGDVRAEDEPGQKVSFEIDDGTTSLDVAKQLENNDLIIDKYAFLIRLKLSEKEIYANTYMLSTSMTYDEIIDTICNYNDKDNKVNNDDKDAEDARQL